MYIFGTINEEGFLNGKDMLFFYGLFDISDSSELTKIDIIRFNAKFSNFKNQSEYVGECVVYCYNIDW